MIRKYLLGFIVWFLYRCLLATWRLQIIEPDSLKQRLKNREPMLFAHWHGDEIPLICLARRYRIATIVSTSKDGEMMNTVLHLLGAKTSRGSSTRGAVSALKGLLRLMKQGHSVSFAVDGPKGPLYQVKSGAFEVSRLGKIPIYPGGVACDRAWVFKKSWNQSFLPKPFSRVIIFWSEALPISPDAIDPRSPELAKQLADALHNARVEALKKFAAPNGQC